MTRDLRLRPLSGVGTRRVGPERIRVPTEKSFDVPNQTSKCFCKKLVRRLAI